MKGAYSRTRGKELDQFTGVSEPGGATDSKPNPSPQPWSRKCDCPPPSAHTSNQDGTLG
ncbi:hypothetical protein FIBSPDRAFT_865485, partial [Athelia psychrophila]